MHSGNKSVAATAAADLTTPLTLLYSAALTSGRKGRGAEEGARGALRPLTKFRVGTGGVQGHKIYSNTLWTLGFQKYDFCLNYFFLV